MKLQIETLKVLFMMSVIGLAGCSGCGQKTAEQPPVGVDETQPPGVETPSTERETSVSVPTTPAQKTDDPPSERENLDKMLSANPDDYDTMLTWVKSAKSKLEGESYNTFVRRRIDVLRKLYAINPTQPDPEVLYALAEKLYNVYPQQAIAYCEQFLELYPGDPLHRLMGLWLAHSYLEAGEFEKSAQQFRKSYDVPGEGGFTTEDYSKMVRVVSEDYFAMRTLTRLLEGTDAYRKDAIELYKSIHAGNRKKLGLE